MSGRRAPNDRLQGVFIFAAGIANNVFITLSVGAAVFGLVWLAFILSSLLSQGVVALSPILFTHSTPPPGQPGGLLNAIIGSVLMSVLAVVLGTPIGLFAGTYLAEYGKHTNFAFVVRFVNDILLSARHPSSPACLSTRSWSCRWDISRPGPARCR